MLGIEPDGQSLSGGNGQEGRHGETRELSHKSLGLRSGMESQGRLKSEIASGSLVGESPLWDLNGPCLGLVSARPTSEPPSGCWPPCNIYSFPRLQVSSVRQGQGQGVSPFFTGPASPVSPPFLSSSLSSFAFTFTIPILNVWVLCLHLPGAVAL